MAAWLAESLSCCQPCCLTDCSWGLAQWQEVTPGACAGCRWALCLHLHHKEDSVSQSTRQTVSMQYDSSTTSLYQRGACGLGKWLHPEASRPYQQSGAQ